MTTDVRDMVVIGGGTAGCFAAATAAQEGLDVALVERKSEDAAGHIACGDAIKGKSTFPDVIDREHLREESFTNQHITRARFLNPKGQDLDIPFGDTGAVIDRKRYGEVLLAETERVGADVHYDTVVRDVTQNGAVDGVQAVRDGTPVEYEADVVIDAAGSLSILQDKADLAGATFDTNVNYSHFSSAYREIIEVPDPVDYDDAIVFKPTEELGYLWYFPRSATTINAGLGFQMNKEPMELVDVLRRDIQGRPEFADGEVVDKLGAALPTRRPYDSAVAPGYMAVGDAAAHVNPTTGGGIPGAAKAGHWAAQVATEAIDDGDVSEAALWPYNRQVMTDFGKRFAAMDLYNIFGGAQDLEDLTDLVAAMPGQQLIDVLGTEGTASMGLGLKLKTLVKTFGHWRTLWDGYTVNTLASRLKAVYDDYPTGPAGFAAWLDRRDAIMDDLNELTGVEPKY
jgi:digeranylgeranylglycerophospholipid reductase